MDSIQYTMDSTLPSHRVDSKGSACCRLHMPPILRHPSRLAPPNFANSPAGKGNIRALKMPLHFKLLINYQSIFKLTEHIGPKNFDV